MKIEQLLTLIRFNIMLALFCKIPPNDIDGMNKSIHSHSRLGGGGGEGRLLVSCVPMREQKNTTNM